MKTYKSLITTMLVLSVILGLASFGKYQIAAKVSAYKPERTNTECEEEGRVFDQADVMTDEEEKKLAELIAKKEKEACADIIIVTINNLEWQSRTDVESLAIQLVEKGKFGWEYPGGSSVLLVDNWAEGADAKYCFMTTTGDIRENLDPRVDRIIEDYCSIVNDSPYEGYKLCVEETARYINTGSKDYGILITLFVPLGAAILSAGIFMAVQLAGNKGVDTTTKDTYLKPGSINMLRCEDHFIRSFVTKVKIESDSNRGGGSHGGGGGSH